LTPEERAARLRRAFDGGQITRAQYRENLRRIGAVPPDAEAPPEPTPRTAVATPSMDAADRLAKMHAAYAAGRIPLDTYLENVRRLGGAARETSGGRPSARVESPSPAMPAPTDVPPGPKRVRKVLIVPNATPPAQAVPPVATVPSAPVVSQSEPEPLAAVHAEVSAAAPLPEAPPAAIPAPEPLAAAPAEIPAAAPVPEVPPEAIPSPEPPTASPIAESEEPRGTADEPIPDITASVSALAVPAPELVQEPAVAPPIAEPDGFAQPKEAVAEAPVLEPVLEETEWVPETPYVPVSEEALVTPTPSPVPQEVASESPPVPAEPIPPPTPMPVAEIPVANPPAPDLPGRLDLIAGLYERGAISWDVYARNARALGAEPDPPDAMESAHSSAVPHDPVPAAAPPEVAADVPVANPPARTGPPGLQARLDLIAGLYTRGAISRAVYEKNVARVLEDVEPRLVALRQAFQEGRVAQDAYRADVRTVLAEHGIPQA